MFAGSERSATEVYSFLEDVIHPARIDSVYGCNAVLIVAYPMPEPNIHGIIERKATWFWFRNVPIWHLLVPIFLNWTLGTLTACQP